MIQHKTVYLYWQERTRFLLFISNTVNIEDNSAAIKRKLVQEAAATPAPAPLRVGDVERINTGGEQGKGELLYLSDHIRYARIVIFLRNKFDELR